MKKRQEITSGILRRRFSIPGLYRLYEKYGLGKKIKVFDILSSKERFVGLKDVIGISGKEFDFILSIPHSGLLLPMEFKKKFDFEKDFLIEVDNFSDKVFDSCGGYKIISRLSPFFVDMNREREGAEDKTVPYHLRNGPLDYRNIEDEPLMKKDYSSDEKKKVIRYYDLYHELLSQMIQEMKEKKGYALVIDGHSMTSKGLGRAKDKDCEREDFLIGSLGGKSAHPQILKAFRNSLEKSGFSVSDEGVYTGGFITRKHHDPANDVHVIQLEVKMKLYMYEGFEEPSVRYRLKDEKLESIRSIICSAIRSACSAAERLYS